jgi:hypothetical protein
MIFLVSVILTVAGIVSTYVGIGLARSEERRLGNIDCDRRLQLLRNQLRRPRP